MSCNCQNEHECQFGKKGRLFEICSGKALINGQPISEDLRQKYKDTWKYTPTQHQEGVGTELAKIFAWFWYHEKPGCKCKHYATEMNKNGIEWCRNNIPTIMEWIHEGAKAQGISMNVIKDLGAKAAILLAVKRAEQRKVSDAPTYAEEDVQRVLADIDGTALRPDRWNVWPHVREAMKRRLKQVVSERYHYPNCGQGRGIVTLGGTSRYFGCAWIMVNVLRRLGCQLPVEWWYTDEMEMDEAMISLAESLPGVTCRRVGAMRGWQAKVEAIMQSRFQEVLFLDSDQVPVKDPTCLFDAPEYRATGSVLWPDLPNKWGCDITEDAFKICDLPVPGRERLPNHSKPSDYRPVESGQLLIDKSRAWQALSVCQYMNKRADFWYPEPKGKREWLIYGDKSTFLLAWEMTKTPYVMPIDCDWIGDNRAGAFLQKDFAGEVVFQHRCQPVGKWSLHGVNHKAAGFTHHEWCLEALEDLRSKWIGHPYENIAPHDMGHWFLSHGSVSMQKVHLNAKGEVAGIPGWRWTEVADKLVIADSDKAICILGRDNYANWINHTAGSSLIPAPPEGVKTHPGKFEMTLWSEVVVENEYKLGSFSRDDVVIDIGGHCGFFSYACAARGAGRIRTFEPNPDNFALLAHNVSSLPSIEPMRCGVWYKDDYVTMGQPPGAKHSGGWSAFIEGPIRVPVMPLDAELVRHERVRLLKLDCEGSEYPILYHSKELHRVEEICGEWHGAWFNDIKPHVPGWQSPDDLWNHLRQLGYQVTVTSNPHLNGTLGHFWAYRKPPENPK
jgi:FkbM family methyltransferase